MEALGVSAQRDRHPPLGAQMLEDLEHPAAGASPHYDITFENVQAGERTSHLFRLANYHGALVLGTGDLSELALGWSTYGVGDQMSHYNVNASVPKTLIQFLIRWAIDTEQFSEDAGEVLRSVLEHGDLPGAGPDPTTPKARDEQREQCRRALRASGLLPLLHPALRLPAQQGGVPGPPCLGRSRRSGRGRT